MTREQADAVSRILEANKVPHMIGCGFQDDVPVADFVAIIPEEVPFRTDEVALELRAEGFELWWGGAAREDMKWWIREQPAVVAYEETVDAEPPMCLCLHQPGAFGSIVVTNPQCPIHGQPDYSRGTAP